MGGRSRIRVLSSNSTSWLLNGSVTPIIDIAERLRALPPGRLGLLYGMRTPSSKIDVHKKMFGVEAGRLIGTSLFTITLILRF